MSFFNRETELKELQNLISKRESNVILIYGESGVGKTSVIQKVKKDIEENKNSTLSDKAWVQWPPENAYGFENPLERLLNYSSRRERLEGEKVVYAIFDAHTADFDMSKLENTVEKIKNQGGEITILLEIWPTYKASLTHKLEKLKDRISINYFSCEIAPIREKHARKIIEKSIEDLNVQKYEREILNLSQSQKKEQGYIPVLIESFAKAYSEERSKHRLEELEKRQIGLIDYLNSLRKKYKLNNKDWRLLNLLTLTRGFSREMEDIIIEGYNEIFEDSINSSDQFWKRVKNLEKGPLRSTPQKSNWKLNLHDRLIETLLFHDEEVNFELLEGYLPKAIELRRNEVAQNIALSLESPLIPSDDSRLKRLLSIFLNTSLEENIFPNLIDYIYHNHIFSLNHKKIEQTLIDDNIYSKLICLAGSEDLGLVAKLLHLVNSKKILTEKSLPLSELSKLVENSSDIADLAKMINSLKQVSYSTLDRICDDLDLSDYLSNCSIKDLTFFLQTVLKADCQALNSSLKNERKKITDKSENVKKLISSHELKDIIEFLRLISNSEHFEVTKDGLMAVSKKLKDKNVSNISLEELFQLLYTLPNQEGDFLKRIIQTLPINQIFENADKSDKKYFDELANEIFRGEKRKILHKYDVVKSRVKSNQNAESSLKNLQLKKNYRVTFEFNQSLSKFSIYLTNEDDKNEKKEVGIIENPKLLWDPISFQKFSPKLIFILKKTMEENGIKIVYDDVGIKWEGGVWPPAIDGLQFAKLMRERNFEDLSNTEELIDLGCGTGFISIYLAKRCDWINKIHFCDISQNAISLVKKNARKLLSKKSTSFHRGNAFSVTPSLKKGNQEKTTIVCHPPYIPVPRGGKKSLFRYSDPLQNPNIQAFGTYLIRELVENGSFFAGRAFLLHSNLSEKDLDSYVRNHPKSSDFRIKQIGSEMSVPFRSSRIFKSFEYFDFLQERGLQSKSKRNYNFWHNIKVDLVNFPS